VVDTDGAVTAKETLLNVVGTNDAPTITVVKADTNGLSEVIATADDFDGTVSLSTAGARHGTVTMDDDGNIIYTASDAY
jgi:hypothetical protein